MNDYLRSVAILCDFFIKKNIHLLNSSHYLKRIIWEGYQAMHRGSWSPVSESQSTKLSVQCKKSTMLCYSDIAVLEISGSLQYPIWRCPVDHAASELILSQTQIGTCTKHCLIPRFYLLHFSMYYFSVRDINELWVLWFLLYLDSSSL